MCYLEPGFIFKKCPTLSFKLGYKMSKRIVLNLLLQRQILTNYRNPIQCYLILFYLRLRNPSQSNIA